MAARNVLLVALIAVTALLAVTSVRAYPTTDLFCFMTAARLVAAGADPYDAATWTSATAGVFPDYRGVPRASPCPGRFGYPLWTALALFPLVPLAPPALAAVWQVLLFGGAAIGSRALARATGRPERAPGLTLAVVASQPFWLTVLNAQFGGVLLAAVGSCAVLLSRRPAAAGLALAAGWLKPHVVAVALLLTPLRELRAGRRAPAVAVVLVLVAAVAVSLAVRPAWPADYLVEILENRRDQTAAATSLVGLSVFVTGSPLAGVILVVGVLAAAAGLLRERALAGVELLAVGTAASLVVSPYLGSHDDLLLVPSWAVLFGAGPVLVAVVAVVLPWSLYLLKGPLANGEGLSGLVPALTLLALATVLRRSRER